MANTLARFTHEYSVTGWCTEGGKLTSRRVTSAQLVNAFQLACREIPTYLSEILTNGIRYSFEDFDVLSAACRELGPDTFQRIGTLEAK